MEKNSVPGYKTLTVNGFSLLVKGQLCAAAVIH